MTFAENYSFVIQDAVQGFHWNNQATIHRLVIYCSGNNAVRYELNFLNFVVISESPTHNSVSVHCFLKRLLTFLGSKLTVMKVYYFSDGAASQYKNKNYFVNLAFHCRDFNIEAKWHFFTTAHGKGPCDGVGGTVKHDATRASLKRPLEGQIQIPQQLFEWTKDAILSVTFEFVVKSEIETEELALQE